MRLREAAPLDIDQAAERVGVSRSTIHRIERGAYLPKKHVLERMLDLYGAPSDLRALLIEQRHQAKTSTGWWIAYGDVFASTFFELEEEAATIRSFQNSVVPGILQTEAYAKETIEAAWPGDDRNPKRLEARVLRRTRFDNRQNPPTLHVILDEAVLRRQVGGPSVMFDQITHLVKVAARPHVTIQVVPFSAGAHIGTAGPFVLMSFDDAHYPDVAYVETRAGDLYPEDEPTLVSYSADFARLADEVALSPEDSVGFLSELMKG